MVFDHDAAKHTNADASNWKEIKKEKQEPIPGKKRGKRKGAGGVS